MNGVKNMNRDDFPILKNDLIYLDNGATTLKSNCVIKSINDYLTNYSANAHRGDYKISIKVDLEDLKHSKGTLSIFVLLKWEANNYTYERLMDTLNYKVSPSNNTGVVSTKLEYTFDIKISFVFNGNDFRILILLSCHIYFSSSLL